MGTRLACLFAVAATALAAGAARADVIYQLEPLVGAGATDNARVTGVGPTGTEKVSDSYTIAGGNMRLAYTKARLQLTIGYRVGYTQYFRTDGMTTFTNNLALQSAVELSALWRLGFGVNATLTRASGVNPIDPATTQQQAVIAGSTRYLGTGAVQTLAYQPNPRQGYGQTLSASQVRYLESTINGVPVNLPNTTFHAFGLV